ncbi:MAG: hypothetical protein MUE73_17830 [Planctomycetes bacterium]|nr:hypothetical protein [Planctomycetota bacterium]
MNARRDSIRFGGHQSMLRSLLAVPFGHLPEKVAALLLAVLVWFTIRQELTESATLPVVLKPDFGPTVILMDSLRPFEKATFSGPRAQIETMKKLANTAVTLRVREEDLLGQEQAVIHFSVERGNLRHEYGPDVSIVSTDPPAPLELKVALRAVKQVTARPPAVTGLPAGWESKVEVITPAVGVVGPAPLLRDLLSVEPEPIDGADILQRRGTREDIDRMTIERRLAPAEKDKKLALAEGETIRCQVSLTRPRVTREFTIPFSVRFERQDWPVTLVPSMTDVLQPNGAAWQIRLSFTGAGVDIDQVATAITGGQIRAYVVAEDFEAYRNQEEGRGYLEPVRVEMPDALRRRVSFVPPSRESIEVDVKKR